jgi:flap endonuclease-1
MGVKITELLLSKELNMGELAGKVIAIDASNHLYQFLTTIRAHDGSLFTDSKGRITSHLIGLFYRTANLLQAGITPVYVFDGKPPSLKEKTYMLRKKGKVEAEKSYEEAAKTGDIADMRKYAARTSRLTPDMIKDAKLLLEVLGVPTLQAPSEGEAQAASLVNEHTAYAVASQDADALLFRADRLIRNLSVTGRRQLRGVSKEMIPPELILLKEVLSNNGITQKQLIILAILVGTDYNPGGIKGVGAVKALKLVKSSNNFDKLFDELKWNKYFDFSWKEVYDVITSVPTIPAGDIRLKTLDKSAIISFLCEDHDFSTKRITATVDKLAASLSASHKSLHRFL